MSEFEDIKLTFCCSDMTELPMLKKSDPRDASCKMLEFDAKTEGPGCIHGIGFNPVAASTHVTFKDTMSVELKEQPAIAIWVGAILDGSTSTPADVPLES